MMKRRNVLKAAGATIAAIAGSFLPALAAKSELIRGDNNSLDLSAWNRDAIISGIYVADLSCMTGDNVWQFTCPCGVTDCYPLNGLPEVTTPQSCGNPKHFSVKVG